MQKIGLTGATGHLGSTVYQRILMHGAPCKLLLRKEVAEYANEDFIIGDLNNVQKLDNFAKGCTSVIHCASMVWPRKGHNRELIKTNVTGTKLLFEQCKKNKVEHFVYVSSIHSMVIPDKATVFDESAPLTTNRFIAYDFSKAEVERYLSKQTGIKITIINPTGIIGPGDKNLRAMNQLFYLLFKNKLPMVTAGGYYAIDVRTVAEALLNAILLGKTGKYIVGGEYYSIKELTAIYGEVNKLNGKRRAIPARLMKMISLAVKPLEYFVKKPLPLNSYAVETLLTAHPNISSARAIKDLELIPIPIEKTLEDLHAWFINKLSYE